MTSESIEFDEEAINELASLLFTRPSFAENLYDLSDVIESQRIGILSFRDWFGDTTNYDTAVARFRLAVEFRKRPDLVFRALVEKWDHDTLIREMY